MLTAATTTTINLFIFKIGKRRLNPVKTSHLKPLKLCT